MCDLLEVDVGKEEEQKKGGEEEPALDHLRKTKKVKVVSLFEPSTLSHT